jgi:hypothetical protein
MCKTRGRDKCAALQFKAGTMQKIFNAKAPRRKGFVIGGVDGNFYHSVLGDGYGRPDELPGLPGGFAPLRLCVNLELHGLG